MISRDWHCLNPQCGHEYHSFEKANPPCPACGCLRVDWIPGGGHTGGMARRVDARLRDIADQHGFTNLNSASPSRLNRAAPRIETPPISPELGVKHFAPGFSAPISAHGPICVPSVAPLNLRGKVSVGAHAQRHEASATMPGPSANTVFAGRTMQRTIK